MLRNNRFLNSKGLTLSELLIVLALLSILILLILPIYPSLSKQLDYRFIIQQFEEDFLYAQQLAMAESRVIQFIFMPSQNVYLVEDQLTKERIVSRQLPQSFTLRTNFDRYTFHIRRNGNISQGGSVWFDYTLNGQKKTNRFVFQVATGRVRLEEK